MNINDIFNPGGQLVENPNYTPNNGQPKYIMSANPASDSKLAGLYRKETGRGLLDKLGNTEDFQKYMDYGITPNDWETNLDAQLADAQSNWSKTFNALGQTLVSEIGLGTVKGISDLFDFVINLGISSNNDYTNPVSAKLQEWQDTFNNEVAPVYTTPDVNIANGGLTDWGWYMSNLPSIASSLTLLVPAMGTTKALSMIGKSTQIFNGIGKARRFLTAIDKVDEATKAGKKLNEFQKLSAFINNESVVQKVNDLAKVSSTAFTSRIMENYQEANQVYNDLLPVMYNGDKTQNIIGVKDMSDDTYNNFVNKNRQVLQGVDTSDRLAVAKRLAKAGADRTFQDDMVNGIFDIIELYGLKDFTKFMNAPMRASIRRKHLNSIRYAGKTKDQIEELLSNRKWYQKAKDSVEDYLFGSTATVAGQLSEGAEEAINYVAQEEGMRYGHVLLSGIQDEPFDQRLIEYVKNPKLYDSAFWGVVGGVVFQGVGSYLGRAYNAIDIKAREKKLKDEKAGTDIPTTSWRTAMTDWEVQARTKDVESRFEANKILSDELKLITEQKVNPWVTVQGNHPSLSDEEVAIARRKAIRKRNRTLLMNSMFNGNFNITRAYLESEQVKRGLVEAGLMTEEDANIMQQDAIALADKIEDSYSRNLRAVGNAMRNIDKSKYDEIPIEYYQIIAAENMTHEFEAEEYEDAIAQYQPEINSEEDRLKQELAASGMDYKRIVRSYVLAQQLGEIDAELRESKKRLNENRAKDAQDPRTIAGQSAIRELELRKKVLTDMIANEITPGRINQLASSLSVARAVAATERISEGGYRMNENSKTYKQLDKAIVDAIDDETNFDDALSLLNTLTGYNLDVTREELKEAVHQSEVFDENVRLALSESGKEIKSLNNLSKSLTNAYAQITYNEIARNIELSHIATTSDDVKLAAFNKYNQQSVLRAYAVEQATDTLKRLAKQLNDEYGDVSHALAYGTTETDARNQVKEMLTPEEMKVYDDAMRLLVLNDASVTGRKGEINGETYRQTNLANASLPEMLERAINESRLDNFEDVDELESETEEETKEETEKNSTVEKNLVEEPKKSATEKSTRTTPKSTSEPSKAQIKDFNYNKANEKLSKPVGNLIFNDDNSVIRLDNMDISSDTPNVYLFPIDEENGEYALDFKQETAENGVIEDNQTYDNEHLFVIYPNEDTLNGGVVRQNPKVVVDKEGNVISFNKGIIAKPETVIDNVDESDSWVYSSSSTGGLDEKSGKEPIDEKDEVDGIDDESKRIDEENKKSDEEEQDEEEIYDAARDYISKAFRFAAVRSIRTNEKYDADVIEEEVRRKYEDLDNDFIDDIITKSKNAAINYLKRNSKEFKDIVTFADDASSITDEMIGTKEETEALNRLEKSFANVISNFKRHAIVDNYKGKQVVSLENLLRYINSVVEDTALSNYLYDSIVDELKRDDKYIIREELDYSVTGKNKDKVKSKLLSDATRKSSERIITSSDVNGRSIDFNFVINSLNKEERENVYKLIEQLNIGDKLEYSVLDTGTNYVIEFKINGTVIGSAPVPRINGSPTFKVEEGDKFTSVKKGWIVDIPIDKTGTSNFKQMIIELALNPNNDKDIAKLNEMLIDASYLRRGSDEYKKACKELTKAIANHYGENRLVYSIKKAKDNELISSAEHILNIYKGMALASEQTLIEANISHTEYANMIKDARLASINNWFEKLFNSDSNVFALAKNPNLDIRVDTINEGGLIIVNREDAKPVNQKGVIGSNYNGRLELAVGSLFSPGKVVFTGNNTPIDAPSIGAGNTFVAIPKKNGSFALVHAYPREISAHKIGKDINDEFANLLNAWAVGTRSTSDIKRFIDRLCNTNKDNVPLCKGFKCDELTGGYKGIQIQYIDENNRKQYIKLFETNKYSDKVTVISFPNEKAYSIHKLENRAKAISKLNDIANKALKYNVSTQIIEGNATSFNMSFASFNADGQYVVQLPNGREHVFSSYKSFIIDNGLVNVTTESRNGRTNFANPNEYETSFDRPIITFTEASSTRPVEKNDAVTKSTLIDSNTTTNIGDQVKDYIIANGRTDIVGEEILNRVLTGTQLNSLKKSRLFKYMSLGNIIFVENLGTKQNPAIASHITKGRIINGVRVNAGDIAVSQAWIDLLNSDNIETRFEAVRHLIHEGVHRHLATLSEEQKDKLFNGVEEVYNAFVKANEEENLTAFNVFNYNGNAELRRRYYTNGKLNRKGLEEFLVESITRPILMERLNEISEDGKKITAQKVGNIRSKSLLQKILALIADMFGVNVNKGSLLAKEYKLFNDIITEAKQNITITPSNTNAGDVITTEERRQENQIVPNSTTEEEIEPEPTIEESVSGIEDEYGVDDDSIFPDNTIASLNDFRNSLIKENRDAFTNLINNGGIQIMC